MVYSSENAKWKAYQFGDPFATGAFYVCNKVAKVFCRPDCDARPVTNLKLEIKFVDSPLDAIANGYVACAHCEPLSHPAVDIKFLVQCVASINELIGFLPPLLDENEDMNDQLIKENIMETKKSNKEIIIQTINARRSSYPSINIDNGSKEFENSSLSKNDSDHYRLVDLACRHLALAAAINIFAPAPKSPRSPEDTKGKRRRRGGVLGFKELAAKSKLSAWHFHRVFKSVTGLTPKTYGDKCWEYLKNIKDEQSDITPPSSLLSISGMTRQRDDFASSSTSSPSAEPSPKRVKIESSSPAFTNAPAPFNNTQLNWDIPELSPTLGKQDFTMPQTTFDFSFDLKTEQPDLNLSLKPEPSHMTDFDTEVPNYVKSVSVPDLTKYNPKPPSLFSHSKPHTISPSSESLPMTLTAPSSDKLTMPTMDPTYNMMIPELNDKNDDPVIDELYNFPLSFEIEGNGLDILPEFISTPAI